MEQAVIAVVFVVLVIGVAALVWYFSEAQVVRRLIKAAPRVPIAQFPERTSARIVGPVTPIEVLEAPLSKRRCVYYEVIVERYRKSGKSGSWRRLFREMKGVPFVVTDGTGRAVVDPAHARITLVEDNRSQSGTFDNANELETALLARHGVDSQGLLFNKKLRYRESIIEQGESVAVVGQAVREPDPDGPVGEGYREGGAMLLRLGGSPKAPLLISDRPDTTT